jgi:hypothetical protein
VKILLDTDIGGDIDDALALAYLLKQPHCELLGITTVGGESEQRAALASAICHAAGQAEVPVHVGASAPLLVPERQPHAYQSHAEMLRGGCQALIAELPAWQPFLALIEEERAVSVCRSVRITPAAHEAGVETLPAFRGRGYTPDVVAGWARVVQSRRRLGYQEELEFLERRRHPLVVVGDTFQHEVLPQHAFLKLIGARSHHLAVHAFLAFGIKVGLAHA